MKETVAEQIKKLTWTGCVLVDEPMSRHTTFRVGGCADIFVSPQTVKEATEIVRLLLTQKYPYTVIGNGSNIIVSDSGYRGCIICMETAAANLCTEGSVITAGAGVMLSKVARMAYENSLTGLEFASGIPGTVGGAVVMNAGAYGGEMKDVIKTVTVFDTQNCSIETVDACDMGFGYRTSIIKERPLIVLEACFELKQGNADDIKAVMDDLAIRRREKQPLEYPSAGSTFKRPEGYFAAKLIEDTGLKGLAEGGAQVSEKHAGFVINRGGATATEVLTLIREIKSRVFEKFGVMLETEVIVLGDTAEGEGL